MKIGILGAMLEEVSSIKEMMVIENETIIAGRTYYEGRINDVEVVVVFSRWGKVASASTTTTLINKFAVQYILFTGVAGAVAPQLNIGDIVVGAGLYQHDMDARPFFDQFQIPLTNSIVFEPRQSDVEKVSEAALRFIDNIETVFNKDTLERFSINKPSVYIGLIASGDKFISDPDIHPHLHLNKNNKGTLAVEMEGASVAQICEEYNIPYNIIRVISDKADHSAAIDFHSFVTQVASQYSAGILMEYFGH